MRDKYSDDNEDNKEIEKIQSNNNDVVENKDLEKAIPKVKGIREYPVLLIIVGIIGMIVTTIALILNYKGSQNVSELLLPIIYYFIPFVVSFSILKIGIKELLERKK